MNGSENLLAFWLSRQRQAASAPWICHELARQGRSVYFGAWGLIVQQLLRAKRNLQLDKPLKKLSRFDALMMDDFRCFEQDRNEMEVPFTLMAYRHERGCMLLTRNLPFFEWEVIFKERASTAAAIARSVHNSAVPELNVPSTKGLQVTLDEVTHYVQKPLSELCEGWFNE